MEFKTLIPEFLKLMDEIGIYGEEKYGETSFQANAARGIYERTERTSAESIEAHIEDHLWSYINGDLHDHFGTLEHQLAAIAFNVMMEFYFLKHEQQKAAKEAPNGSAS